MPSKAKVPDPARVPSTPALCLIHGDDDFAVKQRARAVFEQWAKETSSEDRETIDAQAANAGDALQSLSRLHEALQTLPFFGGNKIIWWQHCNFLGDERTAGAQAVAEGVGELAQTLKAFPWDNVRLLVSAGKVDKRKTFFKVFEKLGVVEAFEAWSVEDKDWQSQVERLVQGELRRRQRDIEDEALDALTSSVGPHREQLLNEVEKLCLFAAEDAPITLSHVQAVVTRNKQARAFALGDTLGERDLSKLLRTLDEELWTLRYTRQKNIIGLLYGVISKVRMMILAKELHRENLVRPTSSYGDFKGQLERIPAEVLPGEKGLNPQTLNPYPLFRAMDHARHYSTGELVQAMDLLLQCNQQLVSSSLEGDLALQQTLIKIVRRPPSNAGAS